MSNVNSGCFGIFKKSPNRESNEDNRHVRRSRSSIGSDPLSYLWPNRDQPDRQTDLEPKKKDTKESMQKAREERLNRIKTRSRERSCRKPKEEKTLAQFKKERSDAFALIYEGKIPESETETGKRTGTEIRTESETRTETGSRTGTATKTITTEVPESDDDFKRNIEILEQQIEKLDLRSKVMATMWLSRLQAPAENEEEIRARNIITAHLIKCRNENIFQKVPFNLPPTSDTLANIKQKMFLTRDTPCHDMTLANRLETKAYLNKLFHDSYDGGKFLGKLPVPRDGAFFILHMRPNL